jgi:hypothetical protein
MQPRKSVLNRNPAGMQAAEFPFSTGRGVSFREEEFFFLSDQSGYVLENKARL